METVYIETTIPSLYFDDRADAKTAARREWTRSFWDKHRQRYHLVTAAPVIEELSRAEYPRKAEKLGLLDGIELLPVANELAEIVEVYMSRYVMPRDPGGDAAHLAFASFYKCNYLLTWNCVHLANANKAGHIRTVNTLLGLHVPQIVTPLELSGENDYAT
ncbi:MAG: type II toxin-antitoxin system VapC family toxin [Verrucomicrobia bacterium]|nr:type II toxin-antitoxin system VapC family toxin [Verrucomicrobiota bacterium]